MAKKLRGKIHPNPSRAIRLRGVFDQQHVIYLKTEIKRWRRKSNGPITLYIKSKGGNVNILDLLTNQLALVGRKIPIITVADGRVHSAAACLLVMGDYAYAKPGRRLVFHGVRYNCLPGTAVVREEDAMAMVENLDFQNRKIALELSKAVVYRIIRRFMNCQDKSEDFSATDPDLLEREYFPYIKLGLQSGHADRLLRKAMALAKVIEATTVAILPVPWAAENRATIPAPAQLFKALIDRKFKNDGENTLSSQDGMSAELVAEFQFIKDIAVQSHYAVIAPLIKRFGLALLSDAQRTVHRKMQRKSSMSANGYLHETTGPIVVRLWHLTMALCRNLMVGENSLTAQDAYWLGLVDEVLKE